MRVETDEVFLHPVQLDIAEREEVDLRVEWIGREERVELGIRLAEEDTLFTGVAVDLGSDGFGDGWDISSMPEEKEARDSLPLTIRSFPIE